MKKVFIISAIALSGLMYKSASAQIGVRVGLGIAPRRVYAPVEVAQPAQYLDQDDDYYYLPEVDAYYNVYEQCYYYFDGENWVTAAYLPGEYSDYDWRNAPRYEVRAVRPYLNNDFYRNRYHGREVMAWRSRGHENLPGRDYADRGYRNNGQRYNERDRVGYGDRMDRGYRGRDEHFDNNRPESFNREQPNMRGREDRGSFDSQRGDRFQQNPTNGQRGNRESFDNHMNERSQPNPNENHGNQGWGGQRFDNNRQNNQQPNQDRGEQNRGSQGFERNYNNQRQQAPNAGHGEQNRGGGQQNHEGGRRDQRMS